MLLCTVMMLRARSALLARLRLAVKRGVMVTDLLFALLPASTVLALEIVTGLFRLVVAVSGDLRLDKATGCPTLMVKWFMFIRSVVSIGSKSSSRSSTSCSKRFSAPTIALKKVTLASEVELGQTGGVLHGLKALDVDEV